MDQIYDDWNEDQEHIPGDAQSEFKCHEIFLGFIHQIERRYRSDPPKNVMRNRIIGPSSNSRQFGL